MTRFADKPLVVLTGTEKIPLQQGSSDGHTTPDDLVTFVNALTNPMTTAEDLIVGGASGAPTRQGFAANKFPARASTGGLVAKTITDTALTLLDDATTGDMRTTLGLAIGSNVQAWDADLDAIAGLTATTDNFLQAKSSAWASRTPAQVAVDLQGAGLDVDMVGFRGIPQNSQSGNYTCVAADAGKEIFHPSGAGAGDTFTIPANSSVAYEIGTTISFCNMDSNALSIAITTDTMNLAGPGTTGTRTLAQYGTATAVKKTSTVWLISGIGLT